MSVPQVPVKSETAAANNVTKATELANEVAAKDEDFPDFDLEAELAKDIDDALDAEGMILGRRGVKSCYHWSPRSGQHNRTHNTIYRVPGAARSDHEFRSGLMWPHVGERFCGRHVLANLTDSNRHC